LTACVRRYGLRWFAALRRLEAQVRPRVDVADAIPHRIRPHRARDSRGCARPAVCDAPRVWASDLRQLVLAERHAPAQRAIYESGLTCSKPPGYSSGHAPTAYNSGRSHRTAQSTSNESGKHSASRSPRVASAPRVAQRAHDSHPGDQPLPRRTHRRAASDAHASNRRPRLRPSVRARRPARRNPTPRFGNLLRARVGGAARRAPRHRHAHEPGRPGPRPSRAATPPRPQTRQTQHQVLAAVVTPQTRSNPAQRTQRTQLRAYAARPTSANRPVNRRVLFAPFRTAKAR
jgi:hypothetical protein